MLRVAGLYAAGSLLAAGGLAGAAQASGFGLREGSADWMANAFAGETAKAYDASTSFTNPAGMVRLNQNEIDGALNYIGPSARFSGQNFVGPGIATPGTQGGNVAQPAATGAVFGVWSYAPSIKFGLSVTSPFGQRVSNPKDFVGRYQSLVSSITDINVTLSAALKINEHLSIGGGPVIDYFHSRLTQALNIGINPLVGDPVADLHGDDTSLGFNLGAMYQFNDATRIGLDYRSRIQHDITGAQYVSVPPLLSAVSPRTAAALGFLNSKAFTKVTLPDSVSLGFYHQIDPRWAVMADLQWTHWSLFKNVTITPSNGAPSTILPEDWRNTWFGSVGTSYRVLDKLTLQGGVAYDESPVTDSNRTTRIPDYSRFMIGVGATYAVLRNVNLQAAYLHLFSGDAKIDNAASATSGRIVGKYSDTADSASLGVAVKF
jgi:long-chain fatty acid transport protein